MKTVVVFFAAFIFILSTLQTNAQEVTVQQRKREKLPRHLLNEATNAGAGYTQGSAAKDASESKDPKTPCQAHDDDDDRNPAYQGSCQGSKSPDGSNHHYWSTKYEDTVPALKVNSAGVGDTKVPAAKDSSQSKDPKTPCDADDDDGDRNPAHQRSCHGSNPPSGVNHHYRTTKNEDTLSASKVSSGGAGDTKVPAATKFPVRKDTNTDVQKDDNNEDRNPSFQNRGLASRFPDDNHHYNVGG